VESPRWYLGKGNVEKSKLILKKIAKFNGRDLGDIELKVSCLFLFCSILKDMQNNNRKKSIVNC